MSDELRPKEDRPEIDGPANDAIETEETTKAAANEPFEQAGGDAPELPMQAAGDAATTDERGVEQEAKTAVESHPQGKLERLQKVLAQAGVASRRHAEELITQGRVQVNGKVVTELGTKADAEHDHIRVDGKLLKGSERLRYFVLNKPKGFVTTVTDPEGRPTVMKFFEKLRERLYPVGRLDYMSEGLLLVTNDGDLANKLTKASSGVEKTYLVKVSGQPTEDELEALRKGVGIERGKPGSDKVRTAPARIRMVRHGENPWYEVVVIEGRNRELRKMFEEIGHFVEKIRRVGYGPLVLDVEPGKLRELGAEEIEALRKAAEGKLRTPKTQEMRRRIALDEQMQALAPKQNRQRPFRPGGQRMVTGRSGEFRPKRSSGGEKRGPLGRQGFGGRGRTNGGRSFETKPDWKLRPGNRGGFRRPQSERGDKQGSDTGRPEFGRREDRPRFERRGQEAAQPDRARPERSGPERSRSERPKPERLKQGSRFDRSGLEERPRNRPGRSAGGFGDTRRPEGRISENRGSAPRGSGGANWRGRPKFEDRSRPGESGGARPSSRGGSRSGGYSKSGFGGKGRGAGGGRAGSRSGGFDGGKRRSGPSGGRKRG